jgi:uncharacterized protein (TIGR03435 family)
MADASKAMFRSSPADSRSITVESVLNGARMTCVCTPKERYAKVRRGLRALAVALVAGSLVLGALGVVELDAQLIRAKDGAPAPAFDVASVKQNNSGSWATNIRIRDARYSVENLPLRQIIKIAYGAKSDAQVTGGSAAILGNRYDIEAKIDEERYAQIKDLPPEDRRRQISLMLQALLADRFSLRVDFQTKELPVYALTLANGGPKFHPSVAASSSHHGLSSHTDSRKGEATAYEDAALDGLTRLLAAQPEVGDRTVVNETGLSGKYDWSLHWTRENNDAAFTPGGSAAPPTVDAEASGPALFTAIEEQLGLKLKSRKEEIETMVIEHLEPPSEN